MIKRLEYPFTEEKVRALHTGDRVALSGKVFTGRDRLHSYLSKGGRCPLSLRDGAMYHCGPVVVRQRGEWIVRAAGPTTSMREEPYEARVIAAHGLRIVIGKGGMGKATREACREHGCAYLQAVGGAAAIMAATIVRVTGVHFMEEFGPTEALWEFQVRDMMATVTMDGFGRSLHDRVSNGSRRALTRLLAR